MLLAIVGALLGGGLMGLFLNRCIQRMPDDLPFRPIPQCPSCEVALNSSINWPLVGNLLNKHCEQCQAPLSKQPILVDLLAIFVTGMMIYWRGLTPLLWTDLLFFYGLIVITMIDWNTLTIEPRVIVFIITFRLAWLGAYDLPGLLDMLLAMLMGAGAFYFIGFFYETLRRRQGLGDGDAAVLGMLGLWVGWQGLSLVVLVASLSGLLLGGARILIARQSLSTTQIPFAPFLCFGGMVVYLVQELFPHLQFFPQIGS